MTKAAPSAIIGRTIGGKFVVEAHVGSGAMGEVYRARHAVLGSAIALKLLRSELAREPTFAERFYREAKAASRLDHPASIRIIDFGADQQDGQLYIAMEFLDGRDLLRVIAEDWPLTDTRVVDMLVQALSALGTAHEIGIIHRDLKPENIMVLSTTDDDGVSRDIVKVCDFGIAKISDPRAFNTDGAGKALTSTGAIVGTPEYMSPEQSRGDTLDARSDLYSMGVVLFQLLTRRVPFTAESSLGVVLKQVTDAPPSPSSMVPTVNPRLEAICMKALQKKPEDRYQTAREMRADLRAALGSAAGLVYTESAPRMPRTLAPSSSAPTVAVGASLLPRDLLPKETTLGNESARQVEDEPSRRRGTTRVVATVVALAGALGIAALVVPNLRGNARDQPVRSTAPPLTDLTSDPANEPLITPPLPSASAPDRTDFSRARPPASVSPPMSAAPPTSAPVAITSAIAASTTSSTPPPAPSAVSSAVSATSFDVSKGHIDFGQISVTGVTAASIRAQAHQVRPQLNVCYQRALETRGARVAGQATLTLSIDGSGMIGGAVVTGAPELKTLSRCVQGVLVGRTLPARAIQEDSATAEIPLIFHPD